MTVTKGQRYVWEGTARGAVYVEVLRVARDGTWADIRCTTALYRGEDDAGMWTKRQPLPLHESFVLARP
jgi:hypothetical protein